MPHQLFKLAEQYGIAIEYADFFYPNIEAFYISNFECQSVICLSKTLDKDIHHLRTVFAHELGHHFTSGRSSIKSHTFYRDKIEINREEKRAWRWAANFLIPTSTLLEVYSDDFCMPWQLADFFGVDEELINHKLTVVKTKRVPNNTLPSENQLSQIIINNNILISSHV